MFGIENLHLLGCCAVSLCCNTPQDFNLQQYNYEKLKSYITRTVLNISQSPTRANTSVTPKEYKLSTQKSVTQETVSTNRLQ